MKVFAILLLALATISACFSESLPESLESRIVGGVDAGVGQFPYVVSLKFQTLYGQKYCTGTAISSNFILTAAHCADNSLYVKVVGGSNTFLVGSFTRIVPSLLFIKHPSYNPNTLANDLVLIPVISISNSLISNFPQLSTTEEGQLATLIGFASESPGQPMLSAEVTVMSFEDCQALIPNLLTSNICTAPQGEGSDCTDGSGGPLMNNGIFIGVVSRGNPCATGGPTVFIKVSSFIDFINSRM